MLFSVKMCKPYTVHFKYMSKNWPILFSSRDVHIYIYMSPFHVNFFDIYYDIYSLTIIFIAIKRIIPPSKLCRKYYSELFLTS